MLVHHIVLFVLIHTVQIASVLIIVTTLHSFVDLQTCLLHQCNDDRQTGRRSCSMELVTVHCHDSSIGRTA